MALPRPGRCLEARLRAAARRRAGASRRRTRGTPSGLTVHDDEIRSYIGARGGRAHLRAVLTALSQTVPHGRTASALALRRSVDMLKTRGVVILISDLYDDEEGVDGELRRASRIGHDVAVFHVLTPDELQLPGGVMGDEDAETGQTVLVGPGAASEVTIPG